MPLATRPLYAQPDTASRSPTLRCHAMPTLCASAGRGVFTVTLCALRASKVYVRSPSIHSSGSPSRVTEFAQLASSPPIAYAITLYRPVGTSRVRLPVWSNAIPFTSPVSWFHSCTPLAPAFVVAG